MVLSRRQLSRRQEAIVQEAMNVLDNVQSESRSSLADAEVSPKTVEFLRQLGEEVAHDRDFGLERNLDARLLGHARNRNYCELWLRPSRMTISMGLRVPRNRRNSAFHNVHSDFRTAHRVFAIERPHRMYLRLDCAGDWL
jgi:hypothetical protein